MTVYLESGRALPEALRGAELVVHLAGAVKASTPQEFMKANAASTYGLVRAISAQDRPARLVVCSSLAAAGPAPQGQLARSEEDTPQPVSWYGHSKLAAERHVRRYADRVPVVIVRPPIVYGPGDPAFVPMLAAMARSQVAVKPRFGPRTHSLLHVEDLCTGLIGAALRGCRVVPVYYLSDGIERMW
ncbi:NAD(P)-dependent oxidoreductase [Streptomyces lavendulae]|uniref:NAD-dependent epimerase/dehydratase family protein n=1 Tax=Streptomyces lavendulae TaxID=1914 RepID=UPI0031EE4203